MKLRVKLMLLLGALMFLFCSCGSTDVEKMGWYKEELVNIPKEYNQFVGLVQEGSNLRLVDIYGEDWISTDGGKSFEKAENLTFVNGDENNSIISAVVGTPDGSRILTIYQDGISTWKLVTADGKEILLKNLNVDGYPNIFYSAGNFYMYKGQEIYRIDEKDGTLEFLTECISYPSYLAANENILFVVHQNGVLLYDLQNRAVAEKQDEALSKFFTEGMNDVSTYKSSSMLLYPHVEDIYILNPNGIYSYELYGGKMECIIDGSMCGISEVDREFVSLAVSEESEEKVFYIYYSDGNLMRYAKDKTLSSEPQISLRIYSLYEDGNVRQAVSAYRQKYPELYIKYEVGVNPDYGITKEDALRNLSTEFAAGKGPDILIMDDINYESYAEKGILENLMDIRSEMSRDEYFISVVDGFVTEKGLYVIPLTFAIPVLAGDSEKIAEIVVIDSLEQLAYVLEQTKASCII